MSTFPCGVIEIRRNAEAPPAPPNPPPGPPPPPTVTPPPPPVASNNLSMTYRAIAQLAKMMISPMTAFRIHAIAFAVFSGLPPLVMYKNPAYTMITTITMAKSPSATLIMRAAMTRGSVSGNFTV
ncbi:hypothetical protein FBR07_01390 [Candidatus Uhrbacteria bacterium UHB]|nr:hypothetical protein [Candidatus Uhrbacteria bacterium UHB]